MIGLMIKLHSRSLVYGFSQLGRFLSKNEYNVELFLNESKF